MILVYKNLVLIFFIQGSEGGGNANLLPYGVRSLFFLKNGGGKTNVNDLMLLIVDAYEYGDRIFRGKNQAGSFCDIRLDAVR